MENTKLMRAMAGEWDGIFRTLFRSYAVGDSAERKRLQAVIAGDLRCMQREGQPEGIVNFYSQCSALQFRDYPVSR